MRDNILLYEDYEEIGIKCISCNKGSHLFY